MPWSNPSVSLFDKHEDKLNLGWLAYNIVCWWALSKMTMRDGDRKFGILHLSSRWTNDGFYKQDEVADYAK